MREDLNADNPIVSRTTKANWAGRVRRLARLTHRRRPADDLIAWGQRYLPEHFRRPPSQMHLWLAAALDRLHRQRGTKLNVIGPRGGAKSTLVTLAYVLRAALENWEPYIWIVSDTHHQARLHLDNLKLELSANPLLAAAYPRATERGPVWRAAAVQIAGGATIEAFGTGQRVRGRRRGIHRPTLIVCDDVQNDLHAESALAREHSTRWFHGTLLRAGTPRTNVVHLATALHRDALALQLARTPGWISRTFRAIVRWPDQAALWREWEAIYADVDQPRSRERARAFYEERRPAMDAGAELLWPEEEDLYTLMCMRVESGHTAFEREKQGAPLNPQAYEWPEEYFGEHVWFDDWPRPWRAKTMALDPSKGSDARRGDFSALVMLAVDERGTLFVEADLARRPTTEIVAAGVEWCRRFEPDAFGVEANQFQQLLGEQFIAEFQAQGLVGVTPWLIENRTSKAVRIRRLGPHLAARRLRFKNGSPSTRLLIEQLRQFPVADHDDGPDALEMAIRLAGELLASPAGDGLGDHLPVG